GLPIQVASGAPTFEEESSWIPRPALTPSEIAAERTYDSQGYRRFLDERARERERLREEGRVGREASPRRAEARSGPR
ncbi:MAG: hypothetical protein L0323_23345, partial [Planctomycetes bacterium]|nr:hypothetical protein [Planctomycetota bacterium]